MRAANRFGPLVRLLARGSLVLLGTSGVLLLAGLGRMAGP